MRKAVIFDMYETLVTFYGRPFYSSAQMAIDAGIPQDRFQQEWQATENDRTVGKMSLESALKAILVDNHCYSQERMAQIVQKRVAPKEDCFHHLHPEILPLLSNLREKGIKIGLISNCFSEEASHIRKSLLFPYFDAVCLSYEEGVQKPSAEIYKRCLCRLGLSASECLYVGDGGSQELEAARELGMKAVQAVWYLKDEETKPSRRKEGFDQIETPLELLHAL